MKIKLLYICIFITSITAAQMKPTATALAVPDQYTRVCITPLGIPYEWPVSPSKKDLKDFIVYEKF